MINVHYECGKLFSKYVGIQFVSWRCVGEHIAKEVAKGQVTTLEMEMEVVIKDLALEKQWSQDTRKCILLRYVGWGVVGFCLHIGFVILVCLLVVNIYSNSLWMDGWRKISSDDNGLCVQSFVVQHQTNFMCRVHIGLLLLVEFERCNKI